jgi:hypothetical protein
MGRRSRRKGAASFFRSRHESLPSFREPWRTGDVDPCTSCFCLSTKEKRKAASLLGGLLADAQTAAQQLQCSEADRTLLLFALISNKEDEMGALIPIGGGADAEIKSNLNFAFNDVNIKTVRNQNEDLFDSDHHLHRVAYRLGAYPTRNYGNDPAKAKWFFFLKSVLPVAMHGGVSTADSIKAILSYAMRNPNKAVKRVVFDAVQGPGASPHYVEGGAGNPTQDNQIAPLIDTTGTLMIRLICPQSLNDNDVSPAPNQTGDVDRDQQGGIIEQFPIKIITPPAAAAVLPRKAKKAKKAKAKKQPKKKAKARAKKRK